MSRYGRIAVLAGGPSSERHISLRSGRAVYEALKRKNQDVDFVDVDTDVREKLKSSGADIAFLALHGRFGEDGTVQAICEDLRVAYTGSGVEASRLALNKGASRKVFLNKGISVPGYNIVDKNEHIQVILNRFHVPFVVKPQSEGSSIGLTVVREIDELKDALQHAFSYDDKVLVEEYIRGREITVGVLEGRALPVIEIVARDRVYDYDAKYEDKGTQYIVPAGLKMSEEENARRFALEAHSALNCRDFSRVDMRMNNEGDIFVLEVNTIPGMTERSLLPKAARAAGISFENLCMRLVDLAYRRKSDGKEQFEQEKRKAEA